MEQHYRSLCVLHQQVIALSLLNYVSLSLLRLVFRLLLVAHGSGDGGGRLCASVPLVCRLDDCLSRLRPLRLWLLLRLLPLLLLLVLLSPSHFFCFSRLGL